MLRRILLLRVWVTILDKIIMQRSHEPALEGKEAETVV